MNKVDITDKTDDKARLKSTEMVGKRYNITLSGLFSSGNSCQQAKVKVILISLKKSSTVRTRDQSNRFVYVLISTGNTTYHSKVHLNPKFTLLVQFVYIRKQFVFVNSFT